MSIHLSPLRSRRPPLGTARLSLPEELTFSADGADSTLRLKPEGPYLLCTQKPASYVPVHKLAYVFPLARYHILLVSQTAIKDFVRAFDL